MTNALTQEMIAEAMARAEKVASPRESWEVWLDVNTGEGRLQ